MASATISYISPFMAHLPAKATIKYTTDGSNPKEHGGVYDDAIIIPENCSHVLAIAEKDGIESNQLTIKIDRQQSGGTIQINKENPLKLEKTIRINNTSDVYREIDILKKHNVKMSDVVINLTTNEDSEKWIEIALGKSTVIEPAKLEEQIGNMRESFMRGDKVEVALDYHQSHYESGQKFLDMVADKKMTLENFDEQEIKQ